MTDIEWALWHQSEAAWLAEKSRNPFINPKARKDYQRQSAIEYAFARAHMGVEV